MHELREYKGVLHVHTAYSDSSGRMPYVIECARTNQLDFVVVSDHNTLEARREGWEGWHQGVLLLVGIEVTSTQGHSMVLGLDQYRTHWRTAHPDAYLPEVARLGGTAFIAHPERSNRGKLYRRRQAWPNLATQHYAGIEIWSYVHDFVEWAYPWHLLSAIRDPDSGIAGPHPAVLRNWDHEAERRHVAGIGALDAHEYRFPIPKFRWAMLRLLPLDYLFGTVRTHVLMPPLTGHGAADAPALTAALAAGRSFTAYDFIADATGTQFTAQRGSELALMGDELTAGGELEFVVRLPQQAEISLVRDAQPVARATAHQLIHHDARPGVYRAEARLRNRPWIYTNHIYIRPPR